MSSKHPIDALFRDKLKERSFPVDVQELSEVRSLIDLHNASQAARGGAAHWAWSLLLLPTAFLLWWATNSDRAKHATTSLHTSSSEASTGTALTIVNAPRATPVVLNEALLASGKGTNERTADPSTAPPARTEQTVRPVFTTSAHHAGSAYPDKFPESSATSAENASEAASAIAWMAGRTNEVDAWAAMDRTGSERKPVTRMLDPEAFRSLALGDLHFLGAALGTNASAANATGESHLFGIEYRIKTGRLSAATGVHYATYGLNTTGVLDPCQVRLTYMQVPLLVGYEMSFRRWSLLAQAGITCDLFFAASGSYGASAENGPRTIADESFRTVNFQLMLRPQITYRVSEQLGVVAGPLWQRQLSDVAVSGPLQGSTASSAGASFGLIWRLARTTY